VTFQIILIISGNLSFLNWVTMIPMLAFLDDGFWRRILPAKIVGLSDKASAEAVPSRAMRIASLALAGIVAFLSIPVVTNLLSSHQMMNTSFESLHLVNTYGAFGAVGKERNEIIFEGTSDSTISESTHWKEYEFKCKPGDPDRRPCIISPYHYRLDWQIWFAAMSTPDEYPWTLNFVWKLLHNQPSILSLLANNPFPDKPPRYIRAMLYHYEFAPIGEKAWWTRRPEGEWLPPLSMDDPEFQKALEYYGWQ